MIFRMIGQSYHGPYPMNPPELSLCGIGLAWQFLDQCSTNSVGNSQPHDMRANIDTVEAKITNLLLEVVKPSSRCVEIKSVVDFFMLVADIGAIVFHELHHRT